jgi:hypothetical protein
MKTGFGKPTWWDACWNLLMLVVELSVSAKKEF